MIHYNFFFNILPYIEQVAIYDAPCGNPSYTAASRGCGISANSVTTTVPAFNNPSDPSLQNNGLMKGGYLRYYSYYGNPYNYNDQFNVASAGYQANNLATGSWMLEQYPNSSPPYGPFYSNTQMTLGSSFVDGTSNTILMMEHYAVCAISAKMTYGPSFWLNETDAEVNAWVGGYLYTGATAYTFFTPPATYTGVQPASWALGWSKATGLPPQIEVMPKNCNFWNVQAPRSGGILVGLVDGRARIVNPGISTTNWYYALVPNDNQIPGSPW